MMPSTPAAASRCPIFAFNEPTMRGCSLRPAQYTEVIASASAISPTGVPVPWRLDILHLIGLDA